ncbi:MAG: hypothetical protein J4A00_09080 [Gammaproteobacteria bacterium]|nr:hypothetical protein [Gammaproteobacteria bacterium]
MILTACSGDPTDQTYGEQKAADCLTEREGYTPSPECDSALQSGVGQALRKQKALSDFEAAHAKMTTGMAE